MNKPYELRILNEDESQQLLLKKIFPNQFANECPDNLLPLIKHFVQKCGGWPLALVVLGGILSTKDHEYNTWNEIMLKMDWHTNGSKCLDIISTSYDDLPTHLKPCFMYIASFPEDYKIKSTTLVQLWIAEGFIQHDQSTKTMEDIAHDYLDELVQRCMVQVSERSWSGRVKYCYVHDILHELSIRKAKENNFLLVCSKFNANSTNETSARMRRIAFHECVDTELQIGSVGPNLRSLIYFVENIPNYNELMRMVRVLHLEYGWALRDPKYLKHLTTLRYFRSHKGYQLHKLPTSFWNNKMLMYVKIEGPPERFPMGPLPSVNLENLLTLKGIVARDEWKAKFPHFPRIRKLGFSIAPEIDWKAIAHSMRKLKHLYSLSVFTQWSTSSTHPRLIPAFKNFEQLHSLFLDCFWLKGVVDDSSFPRGLVKLSLKNSSLIGQDPMRELEKLPNLRILRLLKNSYAGNKLVCSAGGFRCLQQLELSGLSLLVALEVKEGAMPVLNSLKIRFCPNLDPMLPDLQNLTHLRELELSSDMHNKFCSSLKGADQHKVAHIPSIKIGKKL
ncbi:hypothetical protein LUZ61_015049 [Rhynchospora tenuis]|uniref:NB-ARC domain-containing protein n=1 Tax=Rhynchospora tenuis TaxID=198213 RepID=A0AAD5WBX3_9POAL|nr:hypothetical protein LUZ61_015049 [Rhynchospora tenuis]